MSAQYTLSSWPRLSRPSTLFMAGRKTWMPGTRQGMTKKGDIVFGEADR